MQKDMFLNKNHKIITETDNFVLMRTGYTYDDRKVAYKKSSNINFGQLKQGEWSEISCCLSIWGRKDRKKYKRFDLIISHRVNKIIKNYKVTSPTLPEALPEEIKNEILLEKI